MTAEVVCVKQYDMSVPVMFKCPGCGDLHMVATAPCVNMARRWVWNGDKVRPTLSPSIRARKQPHGREVSGLDDWVTTCHCQVTNGEVYFYPDSPHLLAGRTVPLEPWPYAADY